MLHRKKACFRQFEITVTSVASAQAISAGKMAMKSRPAPEKGRRAGDALSNPRDNVAASSRRVPPDCNWFRTNHDHKKYFKPQ
jgi:hypothetical protein